MKEEPQRRVRIQWTRAALDAAKALPPKVRKGLVTKVEELYQCSDPKKAHKPLTGLLANHYRLTYSRYRAVYKVEEERLTNGDCLITMTIIVVAVGKREEYSRDDVYRVAEKIVKFGLDKPDDDPEEKP